MDVKQQQEDNAPAPVNTSTEDNVVNTPKQESFVQSDYKPTQSVEVKTQDIQGVNQIQYQQTLNPGTSSDRFYSPLVKNIAAQENISIAELNRIPGSGSDGRLTKDDLLSYINNRETTEFKSASPATNGATAAATKPAVSTEQAMPNQSPRQQVYEQTKTSQSVKQAQPGSPQQQNQTPAGQENTSSKESYSVSGSDEIVEMDRMRRLIADHMVMSKQISPHVTSFVEADVTNLVKWRERIKKDFEDRTGERITFTPIFIEAVVKAIKDMPMVNVSVNGTQIIKKKDINIGMATALPSGNLIVPVIHKADTLNLVGLAKSVNDLANRARSNKLQPDEIKNGTFTITNVGSFGNVMGTPIINQPQVAILAIGIIKKKPAVLETKDGDVIAVRHMMFLSLSYDHRVVDGALGGSFLRRVADYLENWDINTQF